MTWYFCILLYLHNNRQNHKCKFYCFPVPIDITYFSLFFKAFPTFIKPAQLRLKLLRYTQNIHN